LEEMENDQESLYYEVTAGRIRRKVEGIHSHIYMYIRNHDDDDDEYGMALSTLDNL
jgi:hypothetical protein